MTTAPPRPAPMRTVHGPLDLAAAARLPVGDVLSQLATTESGLDGVEARRRLATAGPNVLASHHVTLVGVFVRQLRNPLLILLLAAAGVSAGTGDITDGAIIAAIVVLSVGLGFVNEYRSEIAVAALHDSIRHDALVRRDDTQQPVDVRQLVPGDIVTLRVGDVVAADPRLIEATQLECDEGVLTGESMPSAKDATAQPPGDSAVDLLRARSWEQSSARGPQAQSS